MKFSACSLNIDSSKFSFGSGYGQKIFGTTLFDGHQAQTVMR
jgi:hypothetical protein